MTQVVFNNFKYLRQYYYWISKNDMYEGVLEQVLTELRNKQQAYVMRTFDDFYVISTRKRLEAHCQLLVLDKPKSAYTYSEIKDIISRKAVEDIEEEG